MERWKPIPGFSGYEVSTYGRVRTYRPANGRGAFLNEPREINPRTITGKPYLRVTLTDNDGQQVTRRVHILVLETFIGPRPTQEHGTRHLDGNPKNNHLDNLLWGTAQENADDRLAHGTQVRGKKVGIAKLTEQQVQEIKAAIPFWKKGMATSFANKFGVGRTAITEIRNNNTWRHV